VHPGPLWWAFNWTTALAQAKKTRIKRANPEQPSGWQPSQGAVLLIDEIDKADSDLPNGLLEALGNGQFGVDLLGETVRRAVDVPPPLVIITTNEERELPAAFLRRCFVLTLTLPTDTGELVKRLLERGEIHFSDLHRKHPKLLEEAAHLLAEDRATAKNAGLYKPGVAEYLDLLRALDQWGGEDPHQTLKDLKEFTFCKQPAI